MHSTRRLPLLLSSSSSHTALPTCGPPLFLLLRHPSSSSRRAAPPLLLLLLRRAAHPPATIRPPPAPPHRSEMDSTTISSNASVTNIGNALLPVPSSPITPQPSADAGSGSGTAQPTKANPLAPVSKRSKKCSSDVWDCFEKFEITKKGPEGKIMTELWATSNRCIYKTLHESNRGTSAFWKHLAHMYQIMNGQQFLTLKKDEGASDVAAVETYRSKGI